jgi:hypothetical protein
LETSGRGLCLLDKSDLQSFGDKRVGDIPVTRATPKYHLTLQLLISKAYPTRNWVRGIVAVASHRRDAQVELCKRLLRLAIGCEEG